MYKQKNQSQNQYFKAREEEAAADSYIEYYPKKPKTALQTDRNHNKKSVNLPVGKELSGQNVTSTKTLFEIEQEKINQNKKKVQSKHYEEKKSKRTCRFYVQGYCKYGKECYDFHPNLIEEKRAIRREKFENEVKQFYNSFIPNDYSELEQQIKRIFNDLKRIEYLKPIQMKGGKGNKNQVCCKGGANSLDVMFIIDCTGSMSSWIQACKAEMTNIINGVKTQFSNLNINVSIVGYRDICDREQEFSIFPFSSDIQRCIEFLGKLTAFGGGDAPEDIAGAFHHALNSPWKSRSKYAILIADAPCHGKKYHSQGDDYPNGDPNKRNVEEQIQEFARMGVTMAAIKITSQTDTMFDIFNREYKKISKQDIQFKELGSVGGMNIQAFQQFVTASISSSVSNSTQIESSSLHSKLLSLSSKGEYGMVDNVIGQVKKLHKSYEIGGFNTASLGVSTTDKKKDLKEIREEDEDGEDKEDEDEKKPLKSEQEIMEELENLEKKMKEEEEEKKKLQQEAETKLEFKIQPLDKTKSSMKRYNVVCHTYYIVNDKDERIDWRAPLIQKSQMKTVVEMAEQPFAEGAMRYAFYLKDVIDDQQQVAKLPKKMSSKNYTIDTMKKEIETTVICSYIVNDFNDRIMAYQNNKLLTEFVNAFLYEFVDEDAPYKYAYGENFINGIYEKYNNNAGWIIEKQTNKTQIAQTLSHFSWQLTQGYLLITDLQGVKNVLTDPQIHCIDQERFGSGNLGLYGILLFFNTHECNEYCKLLNLLNPSEYSALPNDFQLFSEIKIARKKNQPVTKLCELCRNPYQVNYKEFLEQRMQSKEFWCEECTTKRNNSMQKLTCINCKEEYRCSQYYYRMKKSDLPEMCYDCRKSDRDRMRREIKESKQLAQNKSQKQVKGKEKK